MIQPTVKDILILRRALQRAIDAEYEQEASGEIGHYDVSEVEHVKDAVAALEATEHLAKEEVTFYLSQFHLDLLTKKMNSAGYDSLEQALEDIIVIGTEE